MRITTLLPFACAMLVACGVEANGDAKKAAAPAATTAAPAPTTAAPAADSGTPAFKVVDGYKVDAGTMKGFQTWRNAACDRCHGPNQEGLVGPSLIDGLKTMSKADFIKTVMDGRPNTQMVAFKGNPDVVANINDLYTYLKGRSDGTITRSRVEPLP